MGVVKTFEEAIYCVYILKSQMRIYTHTCACIYTASSLKVTHDGINDYGSVRFITAKMISLSVGWWWGCRCNRLLERE